MESNKFIAIKTYNAKTSSNKIGSNQIVDKLKTGTLIQKNKLKTSKQIYKSNCKDLLGSKESINKIEVMLDSINKMNSKVQLNSIQNYESPSNKYRKRNNDSLKADIIFRDFSSSLENLAQKDRYFNKNSLDEDSKPNIFTKSDFQKSLGMVEHRKNQALDNISKSYFKTNSISRSVSQSNSNKRPLNKLNCNKQNENFEQEIQSLYNKYSKEFVKHNNISETKTSKNAYSIEDCIESKLKTLHMDQRVNKDKSKKIKNENCRFKTRSRDITFRKCTINDRMSLDTEETGMNKNFAELGKENNQRNFNKSQKSPGKSKINRFNKYHNLRVNFNYNKNSSDNFGDEIVYEKNQKRTNQTNKNDNEFKFKNAKSFSQSKNNFSKLETKKTDYETNYNSISKMGSRLTFGDNRTFLKNKYYERSQSSIMNVLNNKQIKNDKKLTENIAIQKNKLSSISFVQNVSTARIDNISNKLMTGTIGIVNLGVDKKNKCLFEKTSQIHFYNKNEYNCGHMDSNKISSCKSLIFVSNNIEQTPKEKNDNKKFYSHKNNDTIELQKTYKKRREKMLHLFETSKDLIGKDKFSKILEYKRSISASNDKKRNVFESVSTNNKSYINYQDIKNSFDKFDDRNKLEEKMKSNEITNRKNDLNNFNYSNYLLVDDNQDFLYSNCLNNCKSLEEIKETYNSPKINKIRSFDTNLLRKTSNPFKAPNKKNLKGSFEFNKNYITLKQLIQIEVKSSWNCNIANCGMIMINGINKLVPKVKAKVFNCYDMEIQESNSGYTIPFSIILEFDTIKPTSINILNEKKLSYMKDIIISVNGNEIFNGVIQLNKNFNVKLSQSHLSSNQCENILCSYEENNNIIFKELTYEIGGKFDTVNDKNIFNSHDCNNQITMFQFETLNEGHSLNKTHYINSILLASEKNTNKKIFKDKSPINHNEDIPYKGIMHFKEIMHLKFSLKSNYGNMNYIGLTGIEIYCAEGKLISLNGGNKSIKLCVNSNNCYFQSRIDNLLNNEQNITIDKTKMWISSLDINRNNFIEITFKKPQKISHLKIYNLNYPGLLSCGAKNIELSIDHEAVYNIVLRRGPGILADYSQKFEIPYINYEDNNSKPSNCSLNKEIFIPNTIKNLLSFAKFKEENTMITFKPTGFLVEIILISNYGHNKFIGLNEIDFYNDKGLNIFRDLKIIPKIYSKHANIPSDQETDLRHDATSSVYFNITDNIIKINNKYSKVITPDNSYRCMLSKDACNFKPIDSNSKECRNSIILMFDKVITLGYIKIYNYSKQPSIGVKDFKILVDGHLVLDSCLKLAGENLFQNEDDFNCFNFSLCNRISESIKINFKEIIEDVKENEIETFRLRNEIFNKEICNSQC